MDKLGIFSIDGFLLDLGVSSYQLDTAHRGFSFSSSGPLDMRMDKTSGESALDIIMSSSEKELENIIFKYGEERWARKIAKFIFESKTDLKTTSDLSELVKKAIPRAKWEDRIHPATRTFQAFRIAVNNEIESVEKGVKDGLSLLKPEGRGVVITFHSLEDRIVKNLFKDASTGCICSKKIPVCICNRSGMGMLVTKKPVISTPEEVAENSRARSAKMRVFEKF